MITSRSISRVRVRYAETDTMGVVYYANYLVWFEVARTDLLRHSGWSYREMEVEGFSLPVIEAHCEYKQPARYDDEVEVRSGGVDEAEIYANRELRDQKVAFFFDSLPEGSRSISYRLYAEAPGNFHVLPVNAYAMYAPKARAVSTEEHLRIGH